MAAVLAIEMSQRTGGVALAAPDGRVLTEMLGEQTRHDDVMLPAVDRLVAAAGLTPADIDAIAVSIGPGGFTGLRIAVAAVKMLVLTVDARVAAVPSALVVAERIAWDDLQPGPALVALASKRTSFWGTRVAREAEVVGVLGTPQLEESADVDLTGLAALIGDRYLPETVRRRAEAAGVPVLEPIFDPTACLAVGRRMLADDDVTDPRALVPLYPREPEAVTVWRARNQP